MFHYWCSPSGHHQKSSMLVMNVTQYLIYSGTFFLFNLLHVHYNVSKFLSKFYNCIRRRISAEIDTCTDGNSSRLISLLYSFEKLGIFLKLNNWLFHTWIYEVCVAFEHLFRWKIFNFTSLLHYEYSQQFEGKKISLFLIFFDDSNFDSDYFPNILWF